MGLILVFDMDQTILDSSDPYLFERPDTPEGRARVRQIISESLNWNVVNILKRAVRLRKSDKVSAICLLTNNSSTILVAAVDDVLLEITGSSGRYDRFREDGLPEKSYFFDSIMMRQHASRPKTPDNNPPKRIEDIYTMVGDVNLEDVYFFDDMEHELRKTLSADNATHYIRIEPPYSKFTFDRTRYQSVLEALSRLDGVPPILPEPPLPLAAPIAKPLAKPISPPMSGLMPAHIASPQSVHSNNTGPRAALTSSTFKRPNKKGGTRRLRRHTKKNRSKIRNRVR